MDCPTVAGCSRAIWTWRVSSELGIAASATVQEGIEAGPKGARALKLKSSDAHTLS